VIGHALRFEGFTFVFQDRGEMAFQGSLKELPLPDIVQLVSVSGKTGSFTLTREDARGEIYLKNGQIIHAAVGDSEGEEAIFALSIWNSGDFMFTPGEEAPRQTITKSNTNLLMEAARRIDEWRVLSRKIPSIDMIPSLYPRQGRHEQINLNPQEWILVTRIDGQRTISQIAREMDLSSFDVAKILYGLITSELVQLRRPEGVEPEGPLLDLASQIRSAAEEYLGDSGRKSVEKSYRVAVDAIRAGDGVSAVAAMAEELEKTTSLLRGTGAGEQLRARIDELRSQRA
jgi:hypothetical protein